jgi:peroxiredoxin
MPKLEEIMALLNSGDIPLGTKAFDFTLTGVDDKSYGLKDFTSKNAFLVAFICNHCPYVQAIEDRLIAFARYAKEKNCAMVGICSNDAKSYPADSKENLKKRMFDKNYGFPYLIDEDQSVAKNFGAVCTPDLFLFDQEQKLFYHGRLDDNWQDESKVKSQDLKDALDCLLSKRPAPKLQQPSMGCSIKWK